MRSKRRANRRDAEVQLLIGTRKGAFICHSDRRRKNWRIDGPLLAGLEVNHLIRDWRSGRYFAAVNSAWWGHDLQTSADGKRWKKSSRGLGFAPDRGLELKRIWRITPDRDTRPGTLWCGVDPGALFRSDDGGRSWYEITGLNQHPTRGRWTPGAGGLIVHTILLDPGNVQRLYVAISAAGCFRSDDDGATWRPQNRGVRADFLPVKFPEVGQCVHKMVLDPKQHEILYQQNHCGLYRSENGGEKWQDISRGVPSRFGFPMVAHPHESGVVYVVPEISAERRYVPGGAFAVWRSRNGGRDWQKLIRGLPQGHAYIHVFRDAMTADSCDEPGIYAGTAAGDLFCSLNGGDSWSLLHTHLPAVLSLEACLIGG